MTSLLFCETSEIVVCQYCVFPGTPVLLGVSGSTTNTLCARIDTFAEYKGNLISYLELLVSMALRAFTLPLKPHGSLLHQYLSIFGDARHGVVSVDVTFKRLRDN